MDVIAYLSGINVWPCVSHMCHMSTTLPNCLNYMIYRQLATKIFSTGIELISDVKTGSIIGMSIQAGSKDW